MSSGIDSFDLTLLLGAIFLQGLMVGLVLCKRYPEFFSVRTLLKVINPRGAVVETPAERQKRVNELWSNLAHDLRTPMTSVRGYLETALMQAESGETASIRPSLETALRNTEKVVKLADEMFALARLEERPQEIPKERVDIVDLASEVRDRLRPLARKKELSLELHFPDENLFVHGERRLLDRALENLVQNAIKYTRGKGFVFIQLSASPFEAQIAVVDSGEGIPDGEIPKVFDRFYQVEKERSGSERGFGLGLAITREVVVRHQGRIEIQSTPGSGTIMTIVLPRSDSPSANTRSL